MHRPTFLYAAVYDGSALWVNLIDVCSQSTLLHLNMGRIHHFISMRISWNQSLSLGSVPLPARILGWLLGVPLSDDIVFQENDPFMISRNLARSLEYRLLALPLRC